VSVRRSFLRFGATALLAGATFALSTASANAGVLLNAAPSCDGQAVAKVFAPWLDFANYTPLPGGDFEGAGSGWSMTGGATTAAGNSPFYVGGAGTTSLSLPAGSSVTSSSICVGVEHPTVRFFAKRTSGGALSPSSLRVEVLFENATGGVNSLTIANVLSNGSWQPTVPIPVVANLFTLLPGDNTPVAFRFTANGASWSVDDVWVDPYQRK
jgi:hypothetical protein